MDSLGLFNYAVMSSINASSFATYLYSLGVSVFVACLLWIELPVQRWAEAVSTAPLSRSDLEGKLAVCRCKCFLDAVH